MRQGKNSTQRVLVFNPLKRLVAVYQSTFALAKAMGDDWNVTSVRAACVGQTISYRKLYFRYLDDEVEVGWDDLGELDLEEYDQLCGVQRKVYNNKNMTKTGMKYKKKPRKKSPYYPFKNKPQDNGEIDSKDNQ